MLSQSLIAAALLVASSASSCNSSIQVPPESPADAGTPWQEFVSFSIEASSFPDFAGLIFQKIRVASD
jgi:hypothetical protein